MSGSPVPQYQEGQSSFKEEPSSANDNVLHTHYSIEYAKTTLEKSQTSDSNQMAASDDLLDAKLGKASAETDTKIARLEGKIDTLTATIVGKLDAVSEKMSADHEYNRTTRWVMVGLAIAICGLIIGMTTYGDALFGRGMNVRDVVTAVVKEQQEAAKKFEVPAKPPK
jgi:hypothetical protein